ncbi:erythroferrone-like isoform X2 [Prinia subflava]|uniref:erythroferrone-like isoform X2 n=1 Tax=Prinia subflava TaxID=208062 RepID=UPI002FE17CCE
MRLPELCLVLLSAAATGTEPPRAARERPLAPAAAAGRGGPGAARVDPRQAWMLLAGSPGSGDRGRGGSGAHPAPAGAGSPGKPSPGGPGAAPAALAVPEQLLRELQLLLRGVAKMCRTAGEGWKEEESSKGNPQAGAQRRVEAAFHCQTREDIPVEQKMWQELGLFHIPEREGMFHRGAGLNLSSGQYTAPMAGYYAFSSTLHIAGRSGGPAAPLGPARSPRPAAARREPRTKGRACRGSRLRVLICVQSRCQHNSRLEAVSRLESSGDHFTISVTGTLYLQAGQYASVFVDNTAGSPLTVQSGSDFSAILLGV